MLITVMLIFLLLRMFIVLIGQGIVLNQAKTDKDAMLAIWSMIMTGVATACIVYLAVN